MKENKMEDIKLNIENLTKIFTPKGRKVVAVENVNLKIKKGELFKSYLDHQDVVKQQL